jgi:hypothetical protein
MQNYPFWNRTKGKDHVWSFVHDHGACLSWNNQNGVFFKELKNSIFLSHLGDLSSSCFDTFKDIVIPPMCTNEEIIKRGLGGKFVQNRTIFVHFRGQINWFHKYNLPSLGISQGSDPNYSNGIRQQLSKLYRSDPIFYFKEGSSESYIDEVKNSIFCLCPRGFASWSRRLFDAIMLGCIPVIIADDIELPFEQKLNYSTFTVKIMENNIPELQNILLKISVSEIAEMQNELQKVWKVFSYQNPSQDGDAFHYILQSLAQKTLNFVPVGPNALNN